MLNLYNREQKIQALSKIKIRGKRRPSVTFKQMSWDMYLFIHHTDQIILACQPGFGGFI